MSGYSAARGFAGCPFGDALAPSPAAAERLGIVQTRFVPTFAIREVPMLLALAAVLGIGWILAFFVLHVTNIAIHVLALGAVLCAVLQFINVRHAHHRPHPRL